jgi:hypothetical protein
VSDGLLGSGAAHFPKLLAQLLAVSTIVYFLRDRVVFRDERPLHMTYTRDVVLGAGALLAGIVALAAVLERFPGNPPAPGKPSFRETRVLGPGRELSVEGKHGFESGGVWVPGKGSTRFLLLTESPSPSLAISLSNGPEENLVEVRERGSATAVLDLPPEGPHARTVLLRKPYRFVGPRGERFLYVFEIRSRGSFEPVNDRRQLGTYVRVR